MGGPRMAAIALPVAAVLSIAIGGSADVASAAPVGRADLAAAVPAQAGPTSSAPANPTVTPGVAPGGKAGAPSPASPTAATPVTAASGDHAVVGDPVADRRIRRIVITLLALASTVFVVTAIFWRATKPVPKPLARLGTMETREWRRASPERQAELLGRPPALDLASLSAAGAVPVIASAESPVDASAESAPVSGDDGLPAPVLVSPVSPPPAPDAISEPVPVVPGPGGADLSPPHGAAVAAPVGVVPAPNGIDLSPPDGTVAPASDGTAVPAPDGAAVPAPDGTDVPAPDGADVPAAEHPDQPLVGSLSALSSEPAEAPPSDSNDPADPSDSGASLLADG